ncbi:HlyD family efflux transporter periplasmic adaptor subunit [Hydrogenophaga sp.]|uniref:HlyD family efflux transporter periplasmic adaptor subunit n=1 Tax=Hydrogenophaga sp. TaxID=1904254 RepID=UPI0035AFDC5C
MDRALNAPGAVAAVRQHAKPQPLPALRDELQLFEAARNHDGTPAWIIQDPVNNRFFRIGWLEFEMLVHWSGNDVATLIRAINESTPLNVTPADVRQMLSFLSDNQLLRLDRPADVANAAQQKARQRRSPVEWLVHNYLFFRVPLVRPQAALARLKPWLERVNVAWVALVVGLLTLAGLYLVSRQWDQFTHTLIDHFTWTGLLGYGVALLLAKTVHEMGHALVATRYGVRVAHMGVAFLVMFPMLYTDTGESWRLPSSRQRLAIASAGIGIELALAGICTLLWSLTPDGALRNGLFFLATTSWVMTLAINASPFMRFDGYFILSDLLDMPNLHQRSGALARVWLRRVLLGWNDPWPEHQAPGRRRALIAFALITWVYRLVVFLGIALMVYLFFFKVLGIVLMLLEIHWFIARPVMQELKQWRDRRGEIAPRRRWWLAGLVAGGLILLLVPIQSRVEAYGVLRAAGQHTLHAPFGARITQMPTRRTFQAGDVVFVLDSEALGIAQDRSRQLAQAREAQLQGLIGLPDGEQQRQSIESQKAVHEAEAQLNRDERSRLVLRAPLEGTLVDVDPQLAEGVWVGPRQSLGMLVAPGRWVVDALVPEADLERVAPGQTVRLRTLSRSTQWFDGRVAAVDVARTTVLPDAMLEARFGGPLATVPGPRLPGQTQLSDHVARDALFRVRIEVDGVPAELMTSTVRVQIDGASHSLLTRIGRSVAAVLIRESGF